MVKFSNKPVIYMTIRADTSANIRFDLDTALGLAGWTHAATLTNGFRYLLISPEGLRCKCRIQDTGATESVTLGTTEHYIEIQFMSDDESLLGVIHRIIYSNTNASYTGYQIIAGICQMWLSMPGITNETMIGGHRAHSASGGIPAVLFATVGACHVNGDPAQVSELWWSCGIDRNISSWFMRTGRWFQNQYSFCMNGVLHNKDVSTSGERDSYESFPLQLIPLTSTNNVDFFAFVFNKIIKFNDNSPLVIDAVLGYHWQIVGQIWDSFMKSKDTAIDEIVTSTEVDLAGNVFTASWMAYNYGIPDENKSGAGTWFATLYLLKSTTPDLTTESNYVY